MSKLPHLRLLTLLFVSFVAAAQQDGFDEPVNTDPNFKAVEDAFLLFPLIEKDYYNWNTLGSAVFLREKAILTP